MPVRNVAQTLTLTELIRGLEAHPRAARDSAESDVVIPTPQQQSAARKRALLLRARHLGVDADGLNREQLRRAVELEEDDA